MIAIRSLGWRLAFGAAVLALSTTAASAQASARYDLDGDGRVTKAEFRAARTEEIMRLDRDKDGRVTRAETKTIEGVTRAVGGKAAAARIEALWVQGDLNRDGAIARAEADGLADRRFHLYDLNGDGWLNPAELSAARKGVR